MVLWAVFFLGRLLGHGGNGTLATTLEFFGMKWMAVVFLMTVSLLTVDVITEFGFVLHRWAPFLQAYALAADAVFSVIALV